MIELNQEQLELPVAKGAKPYWFLMKNKNGEASISLTMVFWAFILTSILYVLNAFDTIGSIKMRPFDIGAAGVYFTTCCALYFGRRFTDK